MKLQNGFGSVHKVSGNRRNPWRVRVPNGYKDNGTPLYEELGYYKSYAIGMEVLIEYHKNPSLIKNKNITFNEVYDLFWSEKEKDLKNTRSYTSAFKNCKQLHNLNFNDIRLFNLQEAVDALGDKNSAKRKLRTLFNQMYDFAIANDISEKKYSEYIKLDDTPASEIHQPFTQNEKEKLWELLDVIPYIDVILIYIYTGFRPSELLDIECDNGVNLKDRYLQGGSKTKAGKNRIVPIHHRIYPVIEKWYNKGNKYLITNTKGRKMTYDNWKRIFINIMNSVNELNNTHLPHDTRHTLATDLDNLGANQVARQRILGHASKNITDKVYTHKDIEELRKAIELLP